MAGFKRESLTQNPKPAFVCGGQVVAGNPCENEAWTKRQVVWFLWVYSESFRGYIRVI